LNGWAILLGVFLLYGYFILRTRWGMYRLARFSLLANTQLRPYSVIIAAHNEAKNITPCFEALIQQDYPPELYEIILAADRCSDETVAKAQAFRKEFPNLKILEIHRTPPAVSPKKYALSRAVEAAAHEHLLFLDADVVPGPKHLRAMNRYFAEDTAAVVSLMKFFPPQTFWQKFLMFEKLVSWCIAGAGIGWKRPLIAYGGNWGYTKSAFEKVRGFEEIEYSLSGDDDLLLQKMGELNLPMQMCLDSQGWIRTAPPETFTQFQRQRRRHFSAGKKYRFCLQAGYFLFHTANLILWIAGLFYWPALGGLLLKLLGDWLIIRQGKKLFREEFSFPAAILFDFLYLVYNTLIGPLGYIGKVKW
jgi:cellulose synthase/poly-beta-1,6-N-acetylglucosamine synthase-like glycosyltransferase